jgi:hypothetical protein
VNSLRKTFFPPLHQAPMRSGGSLLFLTGTGASSTGVGLSLMSALAIHLMTNTALTGATFDIEGGQRLLP